jgi:hypothetical protein
MTDKHINKAIAEVCGWKPFMCTDKAGNPFPGWDEPPDFCNDLNRMHEAEKTLKLGLRNTYDAELGLIAKRDHCFIWETTARERAEAFIKTIGKWEE